MMAEARPVLEAVGDNEAMANWWRMRGSFELRCGNFAEARASYLETLRMVDERSFAQGGVASRLNLGNLARIEGNANEALAWFREGLVMARDRVGITWALHCVRAVAGVWCGVGDYWCAAHLLGAEEAVRPGKVPFAGRHFYEEDVEALRTALGGAGLEAAWAEGQRMTLEQAIAFALEHEPSPACRAPAGGG
jgi:hypothetical protein